MAENSFVRIDAVIGPIDVKCVENCSMLVVVVREVLRFANRLSAIVSYRRPGNLDRQQAQHEKDKKATHGKHYSVR